MVAVLSYADGFYRPPPWEGLEKIVRFPDGEFRQNSLPNSTVWVFSENGHHFHPEILASDVGCGMAGFILHDVDHKEAADAFYAFLKTKRAIGGGNHFIDLCAPIESVADLSDKPYKILLIHTHGPDNTTPHTIQEAEKKQKSAQAFRRELGEELSALVESPCELIGDWTHNSVALEGQKVIYRKGAVKAEEGKIHFLPAHLGEKILLYTLNSKSPPPYFSMPHATGRKGPLGSTKASSEKAASLRCKVYIPIGISNRSLRSEHPSCFNGYGKIMERLYREHNFFIHLGETRILSYVGKV